MLPTITQSRFLVWLIIGLGVYLGYGYKHSIITKAKMGTLHHDMPVSTESHTENGESSLSSTHAH